MMARRGEKLFAEAVLIRVADTVSALNDRTFVTGICDGSNLTKIFLPRVRKFFVSWEL